MCLCGYINDYVSKPKSIIYEPVTDLIHIQFLYDLSFA